MPVGSVQKKLDYICEIWVYEKPSTCSIVCTGTKCPSLAITTIDLLIFMFLRATCKLKMGFNQQLLIWYASSPNKDLIGVVFLVCIQSPEVQMTEYGGHVGVHNKRTKLQLYCYSVNQHGGDDVTCKPRILKCPKCLA